MSDVGRSDDRGRVAGKGREPDREGLPSGPAAPLSLTERSASGLRMDINLGRQEITIHVGPEQIATLRQALDDAERGGKVFIGDKPLLIIRPVGWKASDA